MRDCFLTVDAGTTAIKVSAVNKSYALLACCKKEYQLQTEGERVTLPPAVYWDTAVLGIRELLKTIDGDRIAGITVTTQGETMIPVDSEGNVLHDAVVWLDGRAGKQAEKIKGLVSREKFYQTTGVPECNELCPVSKLLWFKEEKPGIYQRARYFLLLEDYLILRFTGRAVTEKSLLCTTGYFDIMQDEIWEELLLKLELDPAKIPPVLDCGEVAGSLLKTVAEKLGLPMDIPVVTGAMDQVCGALGAGNFVPGMLTETTGTALCIGKTIEKAPIDSGGLIPVYRHYRKDLQLLLPVCMTAGMALKWFKDTFCGEETKEAQRRNIDVYELLSELAAQAEPLSGGIIMLPYLAGSIQPYQAPDYRGGFLGVGLDSKKSDFIRALMEGVAYMLKENLLLLDKMGTKSDTIYSMGGGSRSDIWCQIKADVNDRKVYAVKESETASIGAAMLCDMGISGQKNPKEQPHDTTDKKEYLPCPALAEKYRAGYEKYSRYLSATL